MTLGERIKTVRKSITPKMSQEKFAEILGTTRPALAVYEIDRVVPTNAFINLICLKFNVNEEWLRTGVGEMFTQTKDSLIDEIARQHSLSEKSRALMEMFLDFDADQREAILNFIDDFTERWQAKQKQAAGKTNKVDINAEVAELLQKYLSLDEQSKEKIRSDIDYEYERSKTFGEESSDAATES